MFRALLTLPLVTAIFGLLTGIAATALFALAVLLVGGMIAGYIGLFHVRAWGAWVSLGVTVAVFLLTPFLGATVANGWSESFYYASAVLHGVVLALVFLGPMRHSFFGDGPVLPQREDLQRLKEILWSKKQGDVEQQRAAKTNAGVNAKRFKVLIGCFLLVLGIALARQYINSGTELNDGSRSSSRTSFTDTSRGVLSEAEKEDLRRRLKRAGRAYQQGKKSDAAVEMVRIFQDYPEIAAGTYLEDKLRKLRRLPRDRNRLRQWLRQHQQNVNPIWADPRRLEAWRER